MWYVITFDIWEVRIMSYIYVFSGFRWLKYKQTTAGCHLKYEGVISCWKSTQWYSLLTTLYRHYKHCLTDKIVWADKVFQKPCIGRGKIDKSWQISLKPLFFQGRYFVFKSRNGM